MTNIVAVLVLSVVWVSVCSNLEPHHGRYRRNVVNNTQQQVLIAWEFVHNLNPVIDELTAEGTNNSPTSRKAPDVSNARNRRDVGPALALLVYAAQVSGRKSLDPIKNENDGESRMPAQLQDKNAANGQ